MKKKNLLNLLQPFSPYTVSYRSLWSSAFLSGTKVSEKRGVYLGTRIIECTQNSDSNQATCFERRQLKETQKLAGGDYCIQSLSCPYAATYFFILLMS